MGVCYCSMFCCTLLYVHSSIAIILMWKRELVALLNLSSWCLVMVERLFLAVPRGSLQFVIVVFPDHTHYFWMLILPVCRMKRVYEQSLDISFDFFVIFPPKIKMKCSVHINYIITVKQCRSRSCEF